MVWQRLAFAVFTALTVASVGLLPAQEKQKLDKGSERLEAAASKLQLNDEQKQQCRACCAEFQKKAEPLIKQLTTLRDEEWQAMGKVLTKDQRDKLSDVFKKLGDKELEGLSKKLNLTEEQKQQVKKIREEFSQQFLKISARKDEGLAREYHDLWMKTYTDVSKVLTKDQRPKLPGVVKQDFVEWLDFAYRPDTLKEVGEHLGLNAEQRKQIQ
jgi:Spy/CpxP family protein refolding chaperone